MKRQEVYEKFMALLSDDGMLVFQAYVNVIRFHYGDDNDLGMTRNELLQLADEALEDFTKKESAA